ncbi:HAD-IC family P-type ATPase [Aliifodinibius sp. S!AR15-10]|uniref:cation-translocating P-type ATPase n=1 Tax=Aliifodinibius sp. S!AR15-10 TaxID=2950437 RepID=UPI00286028AF|nr:HAD-IC family P-type ATPase [Aliifodinibius sp. S!AR15-10]MDR8394389.1 HAD-IC family P-type ATPase [Aliifodinibius sp. S!AR15-10]
MADQIEAPIDVDFNISEQPWYTLTAGKVCEIVKTTSETGLTEEEVEKRISFFGPNEIATEAGLTRWQILIHQFKDPLIYILLAAAFVTFVLQDYVDSGVIMAVVLLNAVIGYVQENKAQSAIRALSRLSDPKAQVIRKGREIEIPSRDLVPGDIVLLSSGGRVAADMRILMSKGLEVDESALTGESEVVNKQVDPLRTPNLVPADQKNMAFAGTIVTQGRAKAVVVRTADSTELGKIASTVKEIGIIKTPLQEKVDRLGKNIGNLILGFALLIAVIGILYNMDPSEIFITVVAMAVSAIPEGLPVVLTITLAIGVRRMANRRAIIRSLPAVETLGSTTVIGSDKTGTLTKNQMTVRQIWADDTLFETTEAGYQLEGTISKDGSVVTPSTESGLFQTLLAGTLANEANATAVERGEPQGDPTEIALHVSAYKGGIRLSDIRLQKEQLDYLPFEPERKFMVTLNKNENGQTIFMKGAPEAVLDRCKYQLKDGQLVPIDPKKVKTVSKQMAAQGLRVLAMAYRSTESEYLDDMSVLEEEFVLTGLQGMEDPVRPEVVEAVQSAQESGIRVIMITGDHIDTAIAIGRQLGLDPEGHGALEGKVLDRLSDEELDLQLLNINIFARVSPKHKYRIVDRLKQSDHVVAVTGDGVNDAPALRAAHLGVAMGKSGTDVAREASDMVLSDDNFATITAAIEEGRIVFSNIRKVTFFLLSTAVGELIVILIAVLMNWPLPFIAVQILWINLVTNGLQDIALAFEPGEPGILKRKPRPPKEGILTGRLMERLGGVGLVLAAGTLGTFWWIHQQTGDLDMARTAAMTQMVVFQFFHVLNCRSLDRSIFHINFFSNKFLFVSLVAALLAHLAVLHVGFLQTIFRTMPLSSDQWMLIVGVGFLVILGGEIDKFINRWRKSHIG